MTPPVDAFDARFDNWRRWCIQKGLHRGRAGSAEGAWRSPQVWDAPNPRPPEIDLPDAILVNRAFTQLALSAPRNANAIKVLVFMGWLKPTRQAQILATHYTRLDELLSRSKIMLRNLLTLS
jgi:hypothetical protein